MRIHSLARTHGLVSLKNRDGKFYKKAILCRTGRWEGENGFVDVTRQLLQGLASAYNKERANAINPNDYAPVLIDHIRLVDNIKGRIDISHEELTVEKIPGTTDEYGLYGSLRIDDEDAQVKVDKGQYAQLSLTFDDETNQIYEVSFVAVEAARRSQVLSQGDKSMAKKSKKKTHSLALVASKNKTVQLALVSGVKKASTSVTELKAQLGTISTKLKVAGIKNQLNQFIREGKMTKAEAQKVDVVKLAALDDGASSMVLGSYSSRKPSTDIIQHGQEGAKAPTVQLSSADFRKLAAAQKKGSTTSLSSGDQNETDEEKEKRLKKLNENPTRDEVHSLEMEDVKDINATIAKCLESLNSVVEQLGGIGSSAESLSVDEKELEELSSGDEADDEDDKPGDE